MNELKLEDLSVKQKLGMVMIGIIRPTGYEDKYETFDENLEFVLNLIRNHSLGAVWVPPGIERRDEVMKKIKEIADYPILIMTDAESGLGEHLIGRHNALGMTGSEELAYTFGKVTAITARNWGYNVVCCPVLDMSKGVGPSGANNRSMGNDKYQVSKLAVAEARGLRDGGVLTVAKHYPGTKGKYDSHMAESSSEETKEDILDYHLYPYLELMKRGLLDGIMTSHHKLVNIDNEYTTSLSKKVIDIIREQGFQGFAITDALDMMGIKAKFGDTRAKGLCIAAGNELILPWFSAKKAYRDLCECYEEGIITDDRLDEAVCRVLEAQHKVFNSAPKFTEVTGEDVENFNRINRDGIYAHVDEGLEVPISREGRHFFTMIVRNETDIADDGKVSVDTFTNGWHFPTKITKKLETYFPNSLVRAISQFPTQAQNMNVLQDSLDYDDVIFITFAEAPAYTGSDRLTHRMVALINAMQVTNRISTIVHFGDPLVLEELSHMPRIIIGAVSPESVNAAIEVLAGDNQAKGVLTYDVNFK